MEMNNLAGDPRYGTVIRQLKTTLDAWMKSQGDLGIDTEMDALNHQGKALKKQKPANRNNRRRK